MSADGGALGRGLLLDRLAEVDQADEALVLGQPDRALRPASVRSTSGVRQ